MTPEQFVYWLQGFFELEKPDFMNSKQVFEVQSHLAKVFNQPPKDSPGVFYGGIDGEVHINLMTEKGLINKSRWNFTTQQWEHDEPIPFANAWYNTTHPVSC